MLCFDKHQMICMNQFDKVLFCQKYLAVVAINRFNFPVYDLDLST